MERKLQILLSELYGECLDDRTEKLKEEFKELLEAIKQYKEIPCPKIKNELIDELGDVYAVLTHIAHIMGISEEDLSDLVFEKIVKRIKNPNYKREK